MSSKRAYLLVNTGSPEAATRSAIRSFYREFLMDFRVLDIPYFWRALLVHGIIAPLRPWRMQKAYRSISKDGMPLLTISTTLEQKLQKRLKHPVRVVMRLGRNNIAKGLAELAKEGAREITVLPLFPEQADATTGSVLAECYRALARLRYPLAIHVIPDFYSNPAYLEALHQHIRLHLAALAPEPDLLVVSFHGLPERYLKQYRPACLTENCCNEGARAGCYKAQCLSTVACIEKKVSIPVLPAFQSRFGKERWTQPSLVQVVAENARSGKSMAVVAPSFVADCLETLYEIGFEARELASAQGGSLSYLSCLNAEDYWVDALVSILGA